MFISHHQNIGQNQNIRSANKSLENEADFKYLEMTITNQNYIHYKIKSTLNFKNATIIQLRIFYLVSYLRIRKLK
jgi:hypothetical protein